MPFVSYKGQQLHYREDGEGAPVVALHGSASTGRQWESLTGYLGGRYRMIRPDLPGYGKSAALRAAGRAPYFDEIVEALGELLHHVGEPAHLVGHSYGGAIALEVARAMPHAIRSLTVIEPAAFHLLANDPSQRRHLGALMKIVETMHGARARGDEAAAMGCFIDFWNGEGAWERTSRDLRGKLAQTTGQVMDDFVAISASAATASDYASIACPVLAVRTGWSPEVARRVTDCLVAGFPAVRLAHIADAGHMAPLTDPHIVDPMIAAHVIAAQEARHAQPAGYAMAA